MLFENTILGKTFFTYVTAEWFLSSMNQLVSHKMTRCSKWFVTYFTYKWYVSGMNKQVISKAV